MSSVFNESSLEENTRWLDENSGKLAHIPKYLAQWLIIRNQGVGAFFPTRAEAHEYVKTEGLQGVAIIWPVTSDLRG